MAAASLQHGQHRVRADVPEETPDTPAANLEDIEAAPEPADDPEEADRAFGRRTGARPKKAAPKKAKGKGRPRTRAATAALKRGGGEPAYGWGGRLRPRRR